MRGLKKRQKEGSFAYEECMSYFACLFTHQLMVIPIRGLYFSMLMAREECKPWVFSNFIQIYALKDLYNKGIRTGTIDFFYNLYGDWTYFHLKANPWIRINSMPFEFS